jgi:hypothetical protein
MIVRLMGEGQYEIDKKHVDEINKIDNDLVKIVNKGDEKTFKVEFKKLNDTVRKYGKPLSNDILKPSEVIIPPSDISIEDAKKIFKGEGLIKD